MRHQKSEGDAIHGDTEEPRCSFCGKGRSSVKRLFSSPNARICDACVTLATETILEEEEQRGD